MILFRFRQRFIYEINCKDLKNENIPAIVDAFGLWLRKDQHTGNFFCGLNNSQESLDEGESNKVTYFSKFVWPRLVNHVELFKKNIEIVNVFEQNYDYNLIDDNGLIGLHPEFSNLYWILGFNGNHDIWSPALGAIVGKATSELVSNQKSFNIINLDKFGWQRVLNSSRLKERLSN